MLGQAKKFGREKYDRWKERHSRGLTAIDPLGAAVVELLIDLDDLGGLDTLAFVQPTTDWSDFVTYCRCGVTSHRPGLQSGFYDVVYGPVSTSRGTAFRDYEQLSFHTKRAVSKLNIVRTQRLPSVLTVRNVRSP